MVFKHGGNAEQEHVEKALLSYELEKYCGGSVKHQKPPALPAMKLGSPEPIDDERDRRAAFVQQLAPRLRTRSCSVSSSRSGCRWKHLASRNRLATLWGIGFVEFESREASREAMYLAGLKSRVSF